MKVTWGVGVVVSLTLAITTTSWGSVVADTPVENELQNVTEVSPAVDVTTPPTRQLSEKEKCTKMIGIYLNDTWQGLDVTYDLKAVLARYGGPPGKVNATWSEKSDAPVGNATNERPLPIADPEYWIYSYTDTDNKTWARGEHAVHRFTGMPEEFLEVRGQILWTPEDFCGHARRANYIVDDRGFTFEVSREYCLVNEESYSCAWPGRCRITPKGKRVCVAAPTSGLLASLVGG